MIEIIRDGSLERLVVVVFVFGGIVLLSVLPRAFDERLFDLAFLVAGFYFRSVVSNLQRYATQSRKTQNEPPE